MFATIIQRLGVNVIEIGGLKKNDIDYDSMAMDIRSSNQMCGLAQLLNNHTLL